MKPPHTFRDAYWGVGFLRMERPERPGMPAPRGQRWAMIVNGNRYVWALVPQLGRNGRPPLPEELKALRANAVKLIRRLDAERLEAFLAAYAPPAPQQPPAA